MVWKSVNRLPRGTPRHQSKQRFNAAIGVDTWCQFTAGPRTISPPAFELAYAALRLGSLRHQGADDMDSAMTEVTSCQIYQIAECQPSPLNETDRRWRMLHEAGKSGASDHHWSEWTT